MSDMQRPPLNEENSPTKIDRFRQLRRLRRRQERREVVLRNRSSLPADSMSALRVVRSAFVNLPMRDLVGSIPSKSGAEQKLLEPRYARVTTTGYVGLTLLGIRYLIEVPRALPG
jgi:hypothetical protein